MNESASPAAIAVKSGINLEIEYLRAVAVLLVIAAHTAPIFPWLIGQWTGVDLFFCISGYVISRSFEQSFDRAIEDGRWFSTALAFWVRRLFRLAPSAWLWLALNVFGCWAYNSSGSFLGTPEQNVRDALFFLGFGTNFALASGAMHSNRFFWSLTLEDQFYFLFPFFLLLVRPYWRWVVLLGLIALQTIPDRSFHGADLPGYFWVTRLDALMWGCLIQQFSRSQAYGWFRPKILRYRPLAFAVSGALIYLLIEIPKETFSPYLGNRLESQIALAAAGLVFLASFDRGYALPLPGILKDVFRWIGERSYALYLIHIPLLCYLGETWFRCSYLFGEHPPDKQYFFGIAFPVLLLILAEFNFRFFETPLRRKGKVLAQRLLDRSRSERERHSGVLSSDGGAEARIG
jgi:peptidoglycan/LPS O-acetylase OafA/YrhL